MVVSKSVLVLGGALVVAVGFAVASGPPSVDAPSPPAPARQAAPAEDPEDDPSDPVEPPAPGDPTGPGSIAPANEPAAIAWTVPPAWKTATSPSPMRIATYIVPHASGDGEDAEVSVSRAGGDVGSNIERWATQFDGNPTPKRQERKVHGLDVTVVEIEGSYTNAMAEAPVPHAGWMLLAAIVQGPGQPYFFKMTGPSATVRAARAPFTALVDSVRPPR